jgi:hypothetical protein
LLETFPEGSKITIIEPFYKIARGGNRSIRVDDPADVIITRPSAHRSSGPDQAGACASTLEYSKKLLNEGAQTFTAETSCIHSPSFDESYADCTEEDTECV